MFGSELLNLVFLVLKSRFLTSVPADLGGLVETLGGITKFLHPRSQAQTATQGMQIVASTESTY